MNTRRRSGISYARTALGAVGVVSLRLRFLLHLGHLPGVNPAQGPDLARHRGEEVTVLMEIMAWDEICRRPEYRGRWVAVAGCRYDEATAKPLEGTVVDVDTDLVELCNRMRDAGRTCCAVLFCDVDETAQVPTSMHRSGTLKLATH